MWYISPFLSDYRPRHGQRIDWVAVAFYSFFHIPHFTCVPTNWYTKFQISSATLVITLCQCTSVPAAIQAGILPDARVVVFGCTHTFVEALIQEGLRMDQRFVEHKLKPGESKSKIAFLNFSSGTIGKPRVKALLRSDLARIY